MLEIRNIHEIAFKRNSGGQNGGYSSLDLSGTNLGAHIEELDPGSFSSLAHYHTQEEEHVLVIAGAATLHLGGKHLLLKAGDHVWFEAGKAESHTIENTSDQPFRFLVFGERKDSDVVVYPNEEMLLVKALSRKISLKGDRITPAVSAEAVRGE